MEKTVREFIYASRENIVRDLIRLVRVPSVSHPDDAVRPFGRDCRAVLDLYCQIAEEHGLFTKNFDYAAAAAAVTKSALANPQNAVGIWSHADVVPVGDDWIYPPFEGIYDNGLVIGRGAQDNKCSCIAGIYILECLRNIPLNGQYLWYAGCSEECGMQDIDLYLSKYPSPRLNLVADCGFPVCIGEKNVAPKSADNPIVARLTEVFNRMTGSNAAPYTISGSTYASKLPNAYPYGIILGHKEIIKSVLPAGHGDYHQPDEAVEIDNLLEAMVIYVMSIYALDKEVFR